MMSLRARYHNKTYREVDYKESAKWRAESREDVQNIFTILQGIESSHPRILQDPDIIWTVDDSSVAATDETFRKGFCASTGHHGGFAATETKNGSN